MQTIDVIEQDQIAGSEFQRVKTVASRLLLYMQCCTGLHGRERTDRIEFVDAMTKIRIPVIIAHPAISRQTKAIGGNPLHKTGLTDHVDHAPAQGLIQRILLSVLGVEALVGFRGVVRPRQEQRVRAHMLMQKLQGQSDGLGNRCCKLCPLRRSGNALPMQIATALLCRLPLKWHLLTPGGSPSLQSNDSWKGIITHGFKAEAMHVRFYGHLRAGFGLAGGARATARCLQAAGCTLEYVDLALASHAAVQAMPQDTAPQSQHQVVPQVDLVHTNPNILASNPELLQRQPLSAPMRIGYWAWELEAFPDGWERFFADYDEIWCPSSFTAQALALRSPVPVIALPHLPDWSHLDQRRLLRQQQRRQRQSQHPFTFLTLFDFWSTPERKNPEAVIRAFQQAFPSTAQDQPPVQLLIKASSSEQFPEQAKAMEALTAGDPRIRWIKGLLSQEKLDALYAEADALVSLHRAEGFGLTLAEAMALALPVIATGYSGNLDFMPPGSAALIPWQLQTLKRSYGDYIAGGQWAEPHPAAAAAAMRRLAMNPDHARQLGEAGCRIAQERLSPHRLGAIVKQRLGRWWLPEATQAKG